MPVYVAVLAFWIFLFANIACKCEGILSANKHIRLKSQLRLPRSSITDIKDKFISSKIQSLKLSGTDPIQIHRGNRLRSMRLTNTLNFMFYATLGSVLPYMPLYYRKIGLSGRICQFLCIDSLLNFLLVL
jgi:hypothetical protein